MKTKEKILFLSYDGLLDPLGQSQILPYLKILSEKYLISVITFEKKINLQDANNKLYNQLSKLHISHKFLFFSTKLGKLGRLYDMIKFLFYTFYILIKNKYKIIHCRGFLPVVIAYLMKNFFSFKYIFDCRGLWIDERIDNHSFNLDKPFNNYLYSFLKKIEKNCFINADHTVVLTKKIVNEIKKISNNKNLNLTVIPTCADYDFFIPQPINHKLKSNLNIALNKKVICYCGSLGGVYLFKEMIDFFTRLKLKNNEYVFLIITNTLEYAIKEVEKISDPDIRNSIKLTKINRNEMPLYLSIVDLMIVFINDTYARQASSPTKVAEALAMGIPVIANMNVGDLDEIIEKYNAGISVNIKNNKDIEDVIISISNYKKMDGLGLRNRTRDDFGLECAKKKYLNIYNSLINL